MSAAVDIHHVPVEQKIRIYFRIFFALAILTALEIGAVYAPVTHTVVAVVLVTLACTKASLVGYYYMHLSHETKWLKVVACLPIIVAFYAGVLMTEAHHPWRDMSAYTPEKARVFPVAHGEQGEEGEAPASEAKAPEAPAAAPAAPVEKAPAASAEKSPAAPSAEEHKN